MAPPLRSKEAAFIAFQELMELDRHPKVRAQLLKAMLDASADDPRPGITIEEFRAEHYARLREYASTEPPTSRTWIPGDAFSYSAASTLPRSP